MRNEWVTSGAWDQLRTLAAAGNRDAARAALLWDRYRRARKGTQERRHASRAFERAAGKALASAAHGPPQKDVRC